MYSDEDNEDGPVERQGSFVVAGLQDLRAMHASKTVVQSATILLTGERDSDLEDIGWVIGEVRMVDILNMSHTPVRSLKAFRFQSFNVKVLDLSDTRVTQDQVELIGNVDTLRDLQLGSNPLVRDISFVASLTKLETLGVSFTGVTDIAAVAELQRLEFLSVAGNRFTDNEKTAEIIAGIYSLRELDVSFAAFDVKLLDSAVLARLFRLTYTGKEGQCKFYYSNSQAAIGGPIKGFVNEPSVMPRVIQVEVREKTEVHPHFGRGSKYAFYLPVAGMANFGKEIILYHGKRYTFVIAGNGPGRHPFFISAEPGGGLKNYDDHAIFPEDGSGVVGGEFDFTPFKNDPNLVYGECQNHPYMGFPIRLVAPRLYWWEKGPRVECEYCEKVVLSSSAVDCPKCKSGSFCCDKHANKCDHLREEK